MSDSFPVGVTSEDQRLVGLISLSPLEALGEKLLDMFRQFGLPIRFIPISQNYTFPPSKQRDQYLGYEPEGLFKADWFEKHVNKLPSVLLVLLPFEPSLSDNDWSMREDSLQQDLMKVAEQVHGNKIKVMAVLIQQRDYPQSQEAKERQQLAKERILSLRRKVDYDSKSVHLLYTFDLHLGSDAVKKMLTSVSNVCVDQLKSEIKHGKDMRTKVSSAQAHVAKKSQLVLKVRQSLKIGQLYSMRLEEAKSKKEYERAYEDLVQLTHSTLPFPITMNEVKTVAQIIFFKLCRIHFNQARPSDAVKCFREHMRIFRELPRRRSRAASVDQTEEEATALEAENLLVECDKMAWGARQCMIFADLLRECRKVTDEQRRQHEHLQESHLVHTALTFERRRRMLADDLLNKCGSRIADVKTVRKSRFLGGKIEAAERGLDELESQKVVRDFLVGRESQARHRKRVIAVAERWTQAQAREHQLDTSRMALAVRVVMMEEFVALGEHKRVMLLCELCVDRFKDEKWNVLFTRSLRCGAASALALGNMKAFVNYSLQLVAPTCKHLDAAERTQVNEQFLRALAEPSSLGTQFADSPQDDANETVCVTIHREMCPVFETSVSFLERVVLVKNSYDVELTVKSRFALPMHFKSIHLTLVRASDEFKDEVECRVVDNTSHNTRVANTVPFLKLEQGERQQLDNDVKATEAKEVAVTASASLFFQPNETKTFKFTLSEENLKRSDILISGKDVEVLLDIADGSRSVCMTQRLEEAIVPSVERGPSTLTTQYIYSYRRKDAMKGTFRLFRPRLPIPGVDVTHVASANIPSKNIFIDHVPFLLGAKVDHSAPALVGEWHPIDIVIERPAGLSSLDAPKNVHASVKIACAGINGTLTYVQHAGSDSSVTDAGELVTCEDRTFQLLNLVPVDELGSTYVITCFFQPTDSGRSWSNPCCSLILTMAYDTDRGRQLSKTFEFDIPVNNPFNVNWSVFPRKPELLVPDEASKTQVSLLVSEGATAFYDLSIATKHAVNIESIAFIPNEEVAKSAEPFAEGAEKCSFTLSREDVWSNCVGVQPVKSGPVDSLGMLRVTWSRTVLVPSASRVFEKHKSVCSDILLPSVMVLPSRGLFVDVKTSTTATFGVPFTTKVSIINHTVSSEVVTVRLTPNTNFMCSGRTKATVVVQPMATLVMSYCLIGLRVGYCLQPSIQVQMQKDKSDLIDPAIERTIFMKPTWCTSAMNVDVCDDVVAVRRKELRPYAQGSGKGPGESWNNVPISLLGLAILSMDDSVSGNQSSVPTVINVDTAMVEIESTVYRVGVTISVLTSLPVLLAIFHTYRQNSSDRTRNVGRMMVIMGLILFLNLVFNVQHIVLEGLIKHGDSTGTVFKPTFWCTIQAFLVQNTFVPSVTLMACFSFEINALLNRGNTIEVDNRSRHYTTFTLVPALFTSILFFALGKFGPSREWHFKNGNPNYGDYFMCWVNLGDPLSWVFSYLPGVLAALVNVYFLGCIYRHLYNASQAGSAARSHFNSIVTRMSILPTATFFLWVPAMLYFVVSRTETTRNKNVDDTWWEPWLSYLVSACFSLMACVQSVVIVFSNKKVYDSLLYLFSESLLSLFCCCPNRKRRHSVIQDKTTFLLSDPEQFTTDESSFSSKTIQTSDEEDSHFSCASDDDDFGPSEGTSESLSQTAPREHVVNFSSI